MSFALPEGNFTGRKPSFLLYLGVGMLALFKDTLDLAIGFFPGVVTVIGFCISFLIWILLFMFDRSGGSKNRAVAKRSLLQLFIFMVEAFGFGLNYLPWETGMVIVLYLMAKSAWRKQAKESAEQGGYVDEDGLMPA